MADSSPPIGHNGGPSIDEDGSDYTGPHYC